MEIISYKKKDPDAEEAPGESREATNETPEKNFFSRIIQNHYRYQKEEKSEAQIEREKWLVPGVIRFNRWLTLPAAVVLHFCLGSLFCWSIFNKPIDTLIYGEGSSTSTAPIAYYIAIALLGLSAALMGPWLEHHGPRTSCLIGTLLFCSGHLLTSVALYYKQIWLVFISYGVIGGFGSGMCYISPISTLQKWFPDKRGLASGFAVSGFGAGSIVISKVQIPLINAFGLPYTFAILGGTYFIAMILATLVLRTPPPNYCVEKNQSQLTKSVVNVLQMQIQEGMIHTLNISDNKSKITLIVGPANSNSKILSPKDKSPPLMDALLSTDFRLMYLMFLGSIICYLCTISRLSNMITDIFGRTPEEASTIVAINGGFNLAGRLVFPIVSDYFGRKHCFQFMLTVQLVVIALFSTVTSQGAYCIFAAGIWIIAAVYGGSSGTMAAFLTDHFGSANVGACHGVAMTGWALSGIAGGLIYTSIYDFILKQGYNITDAFPYDVNSWWICGVVFLGWVSLLFVRPTEGDVRFRSSIMKIIKKVFCM